MSLPINHLKRTLDRCCGQWEFCYYNPIRGSTRFGVEFLNTHDQYAIFHRNGEWTADLVNDEQVVPCSWLTNRLNGLTRDNSGEANKPVCKDSDEYFGKPLKVYQRTDSEGRDVTGLAGLHDETDTEWQIIRNPLDMVIQEGDEYQLGDEWIPVANSVGKQYGDCFYPPLPIRRRLPLPADFDCVPEVGQ